MFANLLTILNHFYKDLIKHLFPGGESGSRLSGIQSIHRGSRGYDGDTKDTADVKGETAVLLYHGDDGDPENPVDVENMLEMHRILEIQDIYSRN